MVLQAFQMLPLSVNLDLAGVVLRALSTGGLRKNPMFHHGQQLVSSLYLRLPVLTGKALPRTLLTR